MATLAGVAVGSALEWLRDWRSSRRVAERESRLELQRRELAIRRMIETQLAFGAQLLLRVQTETMLALPITETAPISLESKKLKARLNDKPDLQEAASAHWIAAKRIIAEEQNREDQLQRGGNDDQLSQSVQLAIDDYEEVENKLLALMEESLRWD